LANNDQPWIWRVEQIVAFWQLKELLLLVPTLKKPISNIAYQLRIGAIDANSNG